MSYIEENVLGSNEQILITPEKCRIPMFWWWVGGILGCWILLIPLIWAIKKTVEFTHIEYAVTDKKVIEKYGWLSTHCDEMPLARIENLTVTKNFCGGLFHYGNINIQGTNRNNIHFNGVKNPEAIRKQISQLVNK